MDWQPPWLIISNLETQWGEVRAIAYQHIPIDPPYQLFDIISQMTTEHAFEAVEYIRRVRSFPEGWGLYEAELLGILESFIGRSIWGSCAMSTSAYRSIRRVHPATVLLALFNDLHTLKSHFKRDEGFIPIHLTLGDRLVAILNRRWAYGRGVVANSSSSAKVTCALC